MNETPIEHRVAVRFGWLIRQELAVLRGRDDPELVLALDEHLEELVLSVTSLALQAIARHGVEAAEISAARFARFVRLVVSELGQQRQPGARLPPEAEEAPTNG